VARKFKHLSIEERDLISIYLARGMSLRNIGKAIGRKHSTISRELKNNTPPVHKGYYLPHKAHERAIRRNIESHERPRLKSEAIRAFVEKKVMGGWSPELISGRIANELPGQRIGYEAIYQYIYSDARHLIPSLVRKHKARKYRGYSRKHAKSHIPHRVSIDARPEVVNKRLRFGDWEFDTVVSKQSKAGLLVISERKSKALFVNKIYRRTSSRVRYGVINRMECLPKELVQTFTMDNGPENVEHQAINDALRTRSYFCNPYHSWEKGTIENSIGLIRRHFPKKTNFSKVSYSDVKRVERILNNRPRKCLNYATPYETLSGAFAGGM
jgi:IS30 family transposase